MLSSEAISAGSGSLRLRVKALGLSGCRANRAKSSLAIRSENSSSNCWMNSQYLLFHADHSVKRKTK
jgi:hypothetical protein